MPKMQVAIAFTMGFNLPMCKESSAALIERQSNTELGVKKLMKNQRMYCKAQKNFGGHGEESCICWAPKERHSQKC